MSNHQFVRAQKLLAQCQSELLNPSNLSTNEASYHALNRAIRDLSDSVTREIDPTKRDQSKLRLQSLQQDVASVRHQLDSTKKKIMELQRDNERQQLLPTTNSISIQLTQDREEDSLGRSHKMVDDYIGMGQSSLIRLSEQKSRLKGAQKRLLDVLNTLGLSQSTIRWIEKRGGEDKWVFWGGVVVTVLVILILYFYVLR